MISVREPPATAIRELSLAVSQAAAGSSQLPANKAATTWRQSPTP